jgi:hypothetical protein
MNWKTYLLAAVSGYIVLLIVGGLWHFFILRDYYWNILKLNVSAVVVGDILRALMLAYIYPFGMKGKSWRVAGTKFGAWMGIAAGLPAGMYAMNLGQTDLFAWMTVLFLLVQGIANGWMVALVYHEAAAKTA